MTLKQFLADKDIMKYINDNNWQLVTDRAIDYLDNVEDLFKFDGLFKKVGIEASVNNNYLLSFTNCIDDINELIPYHKFRMDPPDWFGLRLSEIPFACYGPTDEQSMEMYLKYFEKLPEKYHIEKIDGKFSYGGDPMFADGHDYWVCLQKDFSQSRFNRILKQLQDDYEAI